MVQRITIAPQGPEFSRFVMGYWRLMDWNMSARQLVSFIEEHLDLGVTTVDHADIYGGYQCEAAFGEAMKLAPHLREKMQICDQMRDRDDGARGKCAGPLHHRQRAYYCQCGRIAEVAGDRSY